MKKMINKIIITQTSRKVKILHLHIIEWQWKIAELDVLKITNMKLMTRGDKTEVWLVSPFEYIELHINLYAYFFAVTPFLFSFRNKANERNEWKHEWTK